MSRLVAIALFCGALGAFPSAATAKAFQIDINAEVLVEGSTKHGGIQPDYLISPHDRRLQRLFHQAKEIGRTERDYWRKVAKVRDLVAKSLPRGDYDDPSYLKLVARYRKAKQPIPLGAYFGAGAGSCRENQLALHLLLQHAGIDNKAIYAKVAYERQGKVREDHGLVVLTGKGRGITVDSYNPFFDGLPLSALERKKGVDGRTTLAPSAKRFVRGPRRIIKVHDFPKIRTLRSGR